MKEENENISFIFYLQLLVLGKTEMQIQLIYVNIRTAHPFSLTFSPNFILIPACSFLNTLVVK